GSANAPPRLTSQLRRKASTDGRRNSYSLRLRERGRSATRVNTGLSRAPKNPQQMHKQLPDDLQPQKINGPYGFTNFLTTTLHDPASRARWAIYTLLSVISYQ